MRYNGHTIGYGMPSSRRWTDGSGQQIIRHPQNKNNSDSTESVRQFLRAKVALGRAAPTAASHVRL